MDHVDQRESQRRAVEQMVSLLRALIAGTATRSDAEAFTHGLWPDSSQQGGPFRGHPCASTVFDSLWNIEQRDGDDDLVRDVDFAQYLRWLTEGERMVDAPKLASVRTSTEQIGRSLDRPTVRYVLNGIGWIESVDFASPYTGRAFTAMSLLDPRPRRPVADVHAASGIDSKTIHDLFDTLAIDCEDLFDPPAIELLSWTLWRENDDGVRIAIARFSGRVKAQRALAKLAAADGPRKYRLEGP